MLAIITGGSSGLGRCIFKRMLTIADTCVDWSLETGVDVSDRDSVEAAANQINRLYPKGPDILINCAGVNKPEFLTKINDEEWSMQMNTNAKAIWLTAKFFADHMRGGVICNIISNASHIPMTHSLAYNASKAAAAMMTRQMAKELWPTHGIRVFGVSPNMLTNTNMTKSVGERIPMLKNITRLEAEDYQLSKLITGEATDPDAVAEFVCWLLSQSERHRYLSGCIMEYGA